MKTIIITALAAGLLVSTAFGQDAANPAAPADANAPSIAVEGGAPVELTAPEEKTAVQIVLLSALPENAPPLVVTEDKDELATLHASITDNPAVKAKLDAGGYTVDDVVAMESDVDGSIVVYVDDRG